MTCEDKTIIRINEIKSLILFYAIMLIDTLFNVKLDEFNQNNLGSNLR